MRRLFPDPAELHLDELYRGLVLPAAPAGEDGVRRAHVALGMVSSLDGAVTLGGTSGQLGGAADRVAFRRLRDACDAILVGAGTVRAEDYRPPDPGDERRAHRSQRGLAPIPRLVIVSSSLDLDPGHRVFGDPDARPIVVTHGAVAAERVDRLEGVAEVVRIGAGAEVDLATAVRELADRGYPRVLCEGGPALAGALLAADLIDELFLTVAPQLVGGQAGRTVTSPSETPRSMELTAIHEHDGDLLLRYRRSTVRR